ncbi:MAG: RteC protein [Mucilaginibacter sp.]|nr:RteC protein [Mucilaginibacter sp.]
MEKFVSNLYQQLKEELEIYADQGTLPVKRLTSALSSIRSATNKLKAYLIASDFRDKDKEIDFFKFEKPLFTAEQIYVQELFTIETNRPLRNNALLKIFYEQELLYIRRFFLQYQFLFQYYKFELKELDSLLFLRGAAPTDIPLPDSPGLDPVFSTVGDYLFAKFIAYERLQVFLTDELSELEPPAGMPGTVNDPGIELKWTGESINLVELAYGIWLTGQVNNGNASVTEIVSWLERHFTVRIGKAHRRWQAIAGRKRVSYTKYLDEVKLAIERRVEEELGR